MVSHRSAVFSSQAALPRRDRSQARKIHPRRCWTNAHVSELRARTLDTLGENPPVGLILCSQKDKRSRVARLTDCRTKSSQRNTARSCPMNNSSLMRLRKRGSNWRHAENQDDHHENLAKAFFDQKGMMRTEQVISNRKRSWSTTAGVIRITF